MQVVLRADGTGNSLMQHNERLRDPLDPITRSVAEISGKRKKTDADHLELGHREFLGGLYTNGNGPCLPAFNIVRCLQDSAKRHKLGKEVLRGVMPLVEEVDVLYKGPRDPEALWKGEFFSRKGVVVAGRRITRTRPLFRDFGFELPIEVDPVIFDLDTVKMLWEQAGRYIGIGDMRPIHGRFVGEAMSDKEWLKHAKGDSDSIWTDNQTAIKRVLEEDADRASRHN